MDTLVHSDTLIILGAGVLLLVIAVIANRVPSLNKAMPTWALTGVLGVISGVGVTYVALDYRYKFLMSEYQVLKNPRGASEQSSGGGGGGAPRGPGGGGGGGMMGPMGGGGGAMMGGGAPSPSGGGGAATKSARTPQRELVRLIGKVARLERGLRIELSNQQASELATLLKDVEVAERTTPDDATRLTESVLAVFTEDQKELLKQIELPADFEGPPLRTSGASGMPARPDVPEDELGMVFMADFNPFWTQRNRRWLEELRSHLGQNSP